MAITHALVADGDPLVGADDWNADHEGSGLPDGGTAGQALIKQSATDGDAGWDAEIIAAAGTGDGGPGDAASLVAGVGADGTADGGSGGALSLSGGVGGIGGTGGGGTGGSVSLLAGDGGTGGDGGGNGGEVTISAGQNPDTLGRSNITLSGGTLQLGVVQMLMGDAFSAHQETADEDGQFSMTAIGKAGAAFYSSVEITADGGNGAPAVKITTTDSLGAPSPEVWLEGSDAANALFPHAGVPALGTPTQPWGTIYGSGSGVTYALLAGTADPSAGAGIPAPLTSQYARDNAGTGELWFKTGSADTDWEKVI